MINKIIIQDFHILTNVGISDKERKYPQEILINLEIELDFSISFQTDNIQDTINYKDIMNIIIDYSQNHSPKLLEKLGWDLIEKLHQKFNQIKKIKIQLFKTRTISQSNRTGIEIIKEF